MAQTGGELTVSLRDWLGASLPGFSVTVAGSTDRDLVEGVSIRLIGAGPANLERRGGRRAVSLDYLITAFHPDPVEQATLFGELALALDEQVWPAEAGASRPLERADRASAEQARTALGLDPAPSILVRTQLVRDQAVRRPRPVTAPLVVDAGSTGAVFGRLYGRAENGARERLMNAEISVATLGKRVRTDHDGAFRIDGLPHSDDPIALEITARGRRFQAFARHGEPFALDLPFEIETT